MKHWRMDDKYGDIHLNQEIEFLMLKNMYNFLKNIYMGILTLLNLNWNHLQEIEILIKKWHLSI